MGLEAGSAAEWCAEMEDGDVEISGRGSDGELRGGGFLSGFWFGERESVVVKEKLAGGVVVSVTSVVKSDRRWEMRCSISFNNGYN